jgi:excisionase family DNA binding protein
MSNPTKKDGARATAQSENRLTYTIQETAEKLGLGVNETYRAASRGDFPVMKLGRRFLVPRQAFDHFIATGKVG